MKADDQYAFIDSQNLKLGIETQGWRLDYQRFRVYLKDKYKVNKAFLFIGYIKKNEEMYSDLKKYGYILIFKPTMYINGKIKGNVDAELVLHTMIQYPNFKKAILISGDGDFACLVEYLKNNNKLFSIMIPNAKRYSSLLSRLNPKIIFMDNLKDKLGYKKRGISSGRTPLDSL